MYFVVVVVVFFAALDCLVPKRFKRQFHTYIWKKFLKLVLEKLPIPSHIMSQQNLFK